MIYRLSRPVCFARLAVALIVICRSPAVLVKLRADTIRRPQLKGPRGFRKAGGLTGLVIFLSGVLGATTAFAQSFAPPVDYTVGTAPYAAALGDFNGDGKSDLAVANNTSKNISVLPGNEDGTFGGKSDYDVGQPAYGLVVTDLNGDGRLDIVGETSLGLTSSVSVLLGNGNGTFQSHVDYSFSGLAQPNSILASDFNNDGKPDVVVVNGSGATVFLGNGDGTLKPPVAYGSSNFATSVAVGDFNADGKLDLAVSSYGSGSNGVVSVMLGKGDGTFFPSVNYASAPSPFSLVKGDFNGDGKLDLATANIQVNSISVLLGNGDGTFQAPVNYATDFPYELSIGDFNKDGKSDLVTAGNGFGLSVLKGNGDGTFQKSVNFQAGGVFATVFDLNGDGKPDIISAGQTNSVAVFINQTGPYNIHGTVRDSNNVPLSGVTVTLSGGAPVVVNTDATGTYAFNDLTAGQTYTVTPTKTNYTFAPLNQTFNNLSSNVTADFVGTLNNYSISGKVRDIYGNGMSGVTMTLSGSMSGTMTSASDGSYAFTNLPGGGNCTVTPSLAKFMFSPPSSTSNNLSSNRVINFTGRVATYMISGGVTNVDNGFSSIDNFTMVLTGTRTGTAVTNSFGYSFPGLPVDGDYTVTAYAAPPTALFTNYLLLPPFSRSFVDLSSNVTANFSAKRLGFSSGDLTPYGIARGDLNGDGKQDVVVATTTGSNIHVLLGNGDGTFQSQVAYFSGGNPYAVVTADFDGDGKLDVASANSTEGNISVFIGNGDGTLKSRVAYSAGSNPNTLRTADFNLDGKLDLVTLGSPNKIGIFLGNGNGTFQPVLTPTAPNAVFSVLAGDLNGDGKPDLVTLDFSGSILVLLGHGDGTFENPVSYPVGTEVVKASLGDLNADGKLDVAVATRFPNAVRVLLGRGDGSFQTAITTSILVEPADLIVQDFDGDGRSDLAVAGFSGGLMFLSGSGDGSFLPAVLYQSGSYSGSLVTGDFNSDGKPDVALTSQGADEVNILLNSLATRTPLVQLSSTSYSAGEASGSATVTVTRTGDTSTPASVNYRTSDSAGLVNCAVVANKASERCDYVTTIGTLRFAVGESSKNFVIPIIDDAQVEGNENFVVTLSGVSGAALGAQSTATVTIVDNDSSPATQNPIDGVDFFVRQQYLDILGRQADQIGFQNWVNTLSGCPNGGFGEPPTSNCDRLHVAAGFFQSDEFLNRGYWAFRFYMVSFNQRPTYTQFIPDMSQVGGPKSPTEEEASKVAFADAFVQRAEFLSKYGSASREQALADALTQNAGLPPFTVTAGMTNGQILRAIAERQTSLDKFLTEGTVSILYFGFQRRDPDTIGYQNNVATLNGDPNNLRHMIFIFIYSTEYRSRFGPQ